MADCVPEKSPCDKAGFTLADWAYSIFKRLCDIIAWLASIRDVLGVKPTGAFAVVPSLFEVTEVEADTVVTVPEGALAITATIDGVEVGSPPSPVRLGVYKDLSSYVNLPVGVDYALSPISPVFTSSSTGTNAMQGHGAYPEMRLHYPTGSSGVIIAVYPTTAKTITAEEA